ncbi:NAD-binding protein [Halobacillus amylolyticus]|uniref:NAD-binding protein n=1 Tax=Halobacillus amylolyticus TaxID=2932259 RepID=UPI0037C11A66
MCCVCYSSNGKRDASSQEDLSKAHIQQAKAIVITSDSSKGELEADRYSIVITIAAKIANPSIKILTEILTAKQSEHAKRAGATTIIPAYESLGREMYYQIYNSGIESFNR